MSRAPLRCPLLGLPLPPLLPLGPRATPVAARLSPLVLRRSAANATLRSLRPHPTLTRLTPYPRPPKPPPSPSLDPDPDIAPKKADTRPTVRHQKRIFTPRSPLAGADSSVAAARRTLSPVAAAAAAATAATAVANSASSASPPYQVPRTASLNLPVYVEKSGTTRRYVCVRKVRGSRGQLARDLIHRFGFDQYKVEAHPTAPMVIVKGAGSAERDRISMWLANRGF